jgi:pyridoxine kinase
MAVLSIQSAVAYGHVGNAVAVPALQMLGHEVWRVDTVAFSNHPGHGQFAGAVRSAQDVATVLQGIKALGVLAECDAVLSGYLGEAETSGPIADMADAVRQARPDGLYVLDPVIGDDGRIFVRDGVLETIRDRLVPRADIVLPNPSELGWLTGGAVEGREGLINAARALLSQGPKLVIVTGIGETDEMASYAIAANAVWRASAPRRERRFNGTGDLFAALFTGWFLRSNDPARALAADLTSSPEKRNDVERRNWR